MPPDFTYADLTAYWQLEESSGTGVSRLDSKGANHLTPQTAGASAAGLIGNAFQFDGTSSLRRASTTDLTMSGNVIFSTSFWFNLPSTSGAKGLIWKGVAVNVIANYEWRVNTSGDKLFIAITNGVSAQSFFTTTATWSANTWTHVAFWYDQAAIYCAINDGTPESTAYTAGSWAGGHPFALGAAGDGAVPVPNLSLMDEVSIWKGYVFTADDITTLYNAGAGYGYGSIAPVLGNPWYHHAHQGL